ncbi:MAG: hypothetical protein WAN74_06660 [Thermoplasmata archaeon]
MKAEPAPFDSPEARHRRRLQYAGLWTLGLAVPALVLALGGIYNPGQQISNSTPTILGLWALFYPLYVYRLHLIRLSSFAVIVAFASIAVAFVSIATGWGNGMTDEPYAMPAFIHPLLQGQNPYTTPIFVTYNQYGTIFYLGPTEYVYLPLLIFLQPFIGAGTIYAGTVYKIYVVLAWAATLYLVRKNAFAVVAIGQPYMALLAASGFNDFIVLLLLTVAFVGLNGKRQKWAEILALGCKQFANVFVVVYWAIKRDWTNLTIAVAVSIAWILPFLLWDPSAFICDAVLLSPSGCGGASAGGVLLHLNYWAWPVWILGVFFVPLRSYYYRFRNWTQRGSDASAALPSEPSAGRSSELPPPRARRGSDGPGVPDAPAEPSSISGRNWGADGPPHRLGDTGSVPAEISG